MTIPSRSELHGLLDEVLDSGNEAVATGAASFLQALAGRVSPNSMAMVFKGGQIAGSLQSLLLTLQSLYDSRPIDIEASEPKGGSQPPT